MKKEREILVQLIKIVIEKIIVHLSDNALVIFTLFVIAACVLSLALVPQFLKHQEVMQRYNPNVDYFTHDEDKDDNTIQRTIIKAPGGEPLTEITSKNATSINGVMDIQITDIEQGAVINGTNVGIRENSGSFEFATYLSSTTVWHDPLSLSFTNETSFNIGMGQSTGETNLYFGENPGIRYNHTTSRMEFFDGVLWREMGWADTAIAGLQKTYLSSPDHTNTFLSFVNTGAVTFLNSSGLRMTAFVKFAELDSAETFFQRTESGYSCTVQRFGKNASNQFIWEVGTDYDSVCASNTYATSWTMDSTYVDKWTEYSVQVDELSKLMTLYVDGVVVDFQSYSTILFEQSGDETIEIYAGVKGDASLFSIGNDAIWPVGTSVWKGISNEGQGYPQLLLQIPFHQNYSSVVTETVSGEEFAVDADLTSGAITGGL